MSGWARTFFLHHLHRARWRLVVGLGAATVTASAIPAHFGSALRAVAGWDAMAVAMCALAWWTIARFSAAETRSRAAADDPGRTAVWILVLVASAFSLLATSVVLRQAHTLAPEARDLFVGLCLLAVAGAWALTHTACALRYAHLYYRDDDEGEGGLVFPGEAPPAYFDFAYFSFTIGMCFQVSDVTVSSRQIRRTVLGQSLLSFVYNTFILATAINVVVGTFN